MVNLPFVSGDRTSLGTPVPCQYASAVLLKAALL